MADNDEMVDGPELIDGPVLVIHQTTKIVCYDAEIACQHTTRVFTDEHTAYHCNHPDRTIEGFQYTLQTPCECPLYPSRARPPRRTVRAAPTRKREAEVAEALFKVVDAEQALEAKTNEELADLLVEHVWGELNMFGSHSILIGEVIQRLRHPKEPE